ncbi:MAG: hypothetical protein HY557_05320 [Euryarchaeota archaeon]|nr:hypothetical protein [Euryarchaeota archaeon]
MERQQVIDLLETAGSGLKFRQVVDGRFRVEGDSIVLRGNHMSEEAAAQAARRCPPELLAHQLNFWWQARERPPMALALRDDQVVAIAPATTPLLRGSRVVKAVARAIGRRAEFDRAYATPDKAELYVHGPKRRAAVPGDYLASGVHVAYSPTAILAPVVEGYVVRLACANGAVTRETLIRFSPRDGAGGEDWLAEAAERVYDAAIDPVVTRLRKMARVVLNGRGQRFLDHLGERLGLDQALIRAIRRQYRADGGRTLYDAWNALAFVATHNARVSRDQELAGHLLRAAGDTAQHIEVCQACHQTIRA